MKKITKRVLACLLCTALLCGFAVMPQASAQQVPADTQVETNAFGEHIVYASGEDVTHVPAGYTYVYEAPDGQIITRVADREMYITPRVLTAAEAEALAGLEYEGSGYYTDVNGQTMIRKEFNAAQAKSYSNAVRQILGETVLAGDETVSLVCEAYTSQTPVRVLISFETAPVAKTEGMVVALGNGLGDAEINAAKAIKNDQLSVLARAEKSLGYEIQVENQFALLTNSVAATINYGDMSAVSQTEGIKSVILMPSYSVPEVDVQTIEPDSNGEIVFTPNMKYAGPGVGADDAWEFGYHGEGMAVAIIDTGLPYANQVFAQEPTDSESVAYSRDDIVQFLANNDLHAERLDETTAIDSVYYSSKIPYGFNYADGVADGGSDDMTGFGHGSHVAGIVAGNLPEASKPSFQMDTMGIAPEAQLIIMKVFDMYGNCYLDYLVAAIEDAIALGVDSANLSLGMPSGPVYFEEVTEVYDAAYAAGINVVVSAGNNGHAGSYSLWGNDMVKSDTISTGTIGMPGTYDSTLTVASAENDSVINLAGNSIIWYNEDFGYTQYIRVQELFTLGINTPQGMGFFENLKGNYFVFTDDVEDCNGKLLFVVGEKGNLDHIVEAAAEGGAVGIVFCQYQDPDTYALDMFTVTRFDLPMCWTEKANYDMMTAYGGGDRKVGDELLIPDRWNANVLAGQMARDSSWGPTEGLTLKPEITGIGANVFSSYYGTAYSILSGTSMAAPTVTASAALLRQYLRENELVSEEDMAHVVNCLLMSTATPLFDEEHDTYYFVRRQGAGLVNIGSAIASNTYISVEGTNKAKLELGDDPNRTGVYEMTFNVVNFSDTEKTYTLDVTTLGQKADGGLIKDDKVTYLTYDYARELQPIVTSSLEGDTVTVPAGAAIEITVTVELTEAQKSYIDERFPVGSYVEGFIRLLSDEVPSLTVPFLGFYGEFDDGPILEPYGVESTLSTTYGYNTSDQFVTSVWGQVPVYDGESKELLFNKFYMGDTRSPGYKKVAKRDYIFFTMFYNKYLPYYSQHVGFSPNNDGVLDTFQFGYALRRNAENIHYTVRDRVTGEIIFEQDTGFRQKTFAPGYYAGQELSLEWLYPIIEGEDGKLYYDTTNCLLENNTWLEITADVTLEGREKPTESITFTIYIDNEPPVNNDNYSVACSMYGQYYLYSFTAFNTEQYYLDYYTTIWLSRDESTGQWSGVCYGDTYFPTEEPMGGVRNYSSMGLSTFDENVILIDMAHDYAGNEFVIEMRGEAFGNAFQIEADKTEIQVGEELTIRDVGEADFVKVLNWFVSDPTVAEIVEKTNDSLTIRGLSHGTITVSGGIGETLKTLEIHVTDPAFEALRTKFVDVPGHWAEEEILEAVYFGLFKGTGKDTFAPNAALTRAQLVTVLYRMAGSPEVTESSNFVDVSADTWYTDAVIWGEVSGIVKGITEDTFQPDTPVSREQFAAFLYRYAEAMGEDVAARADLSAYADAEEVHEYAMDAMSWAVAQGLIQGTSATTLSPNTSATRAQAATILVRYLQK